MLKKKDCRANVLIGPFCSCTFNDFAFEWRPGWLIMMVRNLFSYNKKEDFTQRPGHLAHTFTHRIRYSKTRLQQK